MCASREGLSCNAFSEPHFSVPSLPCTYPANEKLQTHKEMVEIAAKHESPYLELRRLYAASVLPYSNEDNDELASSVAYDLTEKALQYNRGGIQPESVSYPWGWDMVVKQDPPQSKSLLANPFDHTLSEVTSTPKTHSEFVSFW